MMATYQVDIDEIGIILANMLEQAMQADSDETSGKEVKHDTQNTEVSPGKTSVHIYTAVEHGTSAASPGEHRTPVWPQGQSTPTRLVDRYDPDSRSRSWNFRNPNDRAEGFPEAGDRCFDAKGWNCVHLPKH